MQTGGSCFFRVAAAKTEQNSGESLQKEGKVLGTHTWSSFVDSTVAQKLLGLHPGEPDQFRMVHQQRISYRNLQLCLHVVSRFETLEDLV